MGWWNNRAMRGACNRSNERLAAEIGTYGLGTALLAMGLGHACYPTASYGIGPNGETDMEDLLAAVKTVKPGPCDPATACREVERWLDKGEISTPQVFMTVWHMSPDQFVRQALQGKHQQ